MTLLMKLTLFASFIFPSLPYIMTKFLTWFEILKECAFVDLLLMFLELCLKSLLQSIFLLGLLITVKFWFWFLYSMFEDLIVAIYLLWYKKHWLVLFLVNGVLLNFESSKFFFGDVVVLFIWLFAYFNFLECKFKVICLYHKLNTK